jgi:AcrR family transcriptional regulator
MAKPGRPSSGGTQRRTSAKRERLIDAAFDTVRDEGFARASARAIASRGSFNPALIFYYFDSVNDLLVEALARSSRVQLEKYERALEGVSTLTDLVSAVQDQLRDDMASGHVKVLAELVGSSATDAELRTAVLDHVRPWITFTQRTLDRVLTASGLAGLTGLVPGEQVAFVVVSLFLGIELVSGLLEEQHRIDELLDGAAEIAALVDSALATGPGA